MKYIKKFNESNNEDYTINIVKDILKYIEK